jgi:hypothetical protein
MRSTAGAQTDVILLLHSEWKMMRKQRIMGRELMKPAGFGFVTTRIPATAVAPELDEVGALSR